MRGLTHLGHGIWSLRMVKWSFDTHPSFLAMKLSRYSALLFVVGLFIHTLPAQTLITLTPSSAIGGSPVFLTSVYNSGAYAAGNIFNQQSGAVDMSTQSGFAWFPSDSFATTNRFVTIDLGASYVLSSIQIFNSNQADRATGHFSLSAGSSLTTGALEGSLSTGQVVSSPVALLGSTALTFSAANPVTGQSFSISDATPYRYLTLTLIDMPSSGGPFVNLG